MWYYANLTAQWDPGDSVGGQNSTLVWTLTYDPDASGPQPIQTVTLATGTLSYLWTIPGNLVPFNNCSPQPATIRVRGVNAYSTTVSSSVQVNLLNGACWIN